MKTINFEDKITDQLQENKIAKIYFPNNNYTIIFEESGLCKILKFSKIITLDICQYVPTTVIVLYKLCYFIYEGIAYIIYFYDNHICMDTIQDKNSDIVRVYFTTGIYDKHNCEIIYYITEENKIYIYEYSYYNKKLCKKQLYELVLHLPNYQNILNIHIYDDYEIVITNESIHIYKNWKLICEKYSTCGTIKIVRNYPRLYFILDGKIYKYKNENIIEFNKDKLITQYLSNTGRFKDICYNYNKFIIDAMFIRNYMFIIYDDNTASIYIDKILINEIEFSLYSITKNKFIIVKDGILVSTLDDIRICDIKENIINIKNIIGEIYLQDDQDNVYVIGDYIKDSIIEEVNDSLTKLNYSPSFMDHMFAKSQPNIKSANS